ncbi:hypothetical protein [Anaeromicrobium sediminis]|uniref:hypothetical protein n=1 Tax=Anaeromicrobium sediminis TaxID=1478221 RepID=UPI00113FEFED|nr:hypothetical protein [Anaeromicrobium sediminis]
MYDVTKWFDNAIHMFGSFSFTLLLNYIFHVKKISDSKIVIFVYATSLGIATGVFYEFVEFALDMILKTTTQEGLIDTNLDLIFDTFGAMIASILIIYRKDIHQYE